jgi:glycosyltransferase involved in cell wall biosynthesis
MKRPQHLCVLTSSYPRTATDDTSVFIQRTCEALAAQAQKVSVIVPQDAGEPPCEPRGGVTIRRFRYGIFSPGRLAFGASLLSNIEHMPLVLLQVPAFVIQMLRNALRTEPKPDAVIAFWILAAIPALLYRWITGTPYVLGLRGSDALIFKVPLLSWLSRPLLKGAKQVVTVSEVLRELVLQKIPLAEEKVTVVHNGVRVPSLTPADVTAFAAGHGFRSGGKYLLSVASLRPMKRIEVLLKLVAELSDYELLLCGKTDRHEYVRALRNLSRQYGCEHRVHFLGSVPPDDIFYYLRIASFFVSASSWEGQPNAVLEAMASGTPVCASNIEAHKELIQDGVNGFLFEVDRLDALRERIRSLEAAPAKREALARNGLMAVSHRTWDDCASGYLQLL